MSFSDKGSSEEAEVLVDTLTVDAANISSSSLSSLSGSDFQQFADLSHELTLSEMETEESEVVIETQEEMETETVEEEVVATELGAEEVEIETERSRSPEEILPDIKVKSPLPPLRPLTIAPKPPTKVPISVKPVAGQQLLFIPSSGAGQTIKLVSAQGQDLGTLGRPVTLKSTLKTIASSQAGISLMQPKQVVVKKLLTQPQKNIAKPITTFTNKGNIMFVQKPGDGGQIKLVPSAGSTLTTIPSPTKTITLQQAQEMGLFSGAKLIPQGTSTPKHTVLFNKAPAKAIKFVPQKSPTKILPATQTATLAKGPQRIYFKTAAAGNPTVIPSGQIIQLTGTQTMAASQLHQINIPGKGMQYIKFVSSAGDATVTSTSGNVTTLKTVQATGTPTNILLSEIKTTPIVTSIAPKPIKPAMQKQPHVMVLPNFIQTQTHPVSKIAIPNRHVSQQKASQPPTPTQDVKPPTPNDPIESIEANGIRPRKPCNCTKSQCLKLYCDCFANGEFCHLCNCMNCFNNLENEDHRQRAIKACLERNPNAFRPKIGKAKDTTGDMSVRKHTKGCNCKRSGCLKNYCECYEAKIACSNNCKCIGCRNIEDSMDKKLRSASMDNGITIPPMGKLQAIPKEFLQFRSRRGSNSKQAINFITDEVIEATCQCLLTISDVGETSSQDVEITKAQIIREFGRCLMEIIEYSSSSV